MRKPFESMYALLLAVVLANVGCVLWLSGQTVPAILLIAGGFALIAWWGSRYQRISITIHRKWYSLERSRSAAAASAGRHAYHLATSHGEAMVTKSVYDRVAEGNTMNILGRVENGTIHVIWPLL